MLFTIYLKKTPSQHSLYHTQLYADQVGLQRCKGCPPDHVLQDSGTAAELHNNATQCMRTCAVGKYVSANGTKGCQDCEPGYRCEGGSSERVLCSAGSICKGRVDIKGCDPGRYGSDPGQFNETVGCVKCSAGRFQPVGAQTSCDQICVSRVLFLFRFFVFPCSHPSFACTLCSLVATRKVWDINRANKRNVRLPRLPFGLHLPKNRHG